MKYDKCNHREIIQTLQSLHKKIYVVYNEIHIRVSEIFEQQMIIYHKEKMEYINLNDPKNGQHKILQYEGTPLSTYMNIQRTKFMKVGKEHNMHNKNRTLESKLHHIKHCRQCNYDFEQYSELEIDNDEIDISKHKQKYNEIQNKCKTLNEQSIAYKQTNKPLQN